MYLRIADKTGRINGLSACEITSPAIVRHVICSAADLAEISRVVGRAMTAADVRAAITTPVQQAIRLLLAAAAPLRPRPAPGTPERDTLDYNFRDAFGVTPDFVPSWRPAGQTWDRGAVVRERLRCAARILSNGSMRYHCWGPLSCRDFPERWSPLNFAKVFPEQLRMCFGEHFWFAFRQGRNDVAGTLLHEALHIYFRVVDDPPHSPNRFGNAYCYERFVSLMNRLPLPPLVTESCGTGQTRGDFPLPPRDRVLAGISSAAPPRRRFNYRKWMPHRRQPLGNYGLGACATGAASVATHSDILDTIKCELERKFTSSTDPKLFLRRLRLRELFNAIAATEAKDLAKKLRDPADPLGSLLLRRVSSVTRNDMLTILFLADFDLNFEPTSTTDGVPANPRMTSSEKSLRIVDVNDAVKELIKLRDARASAAPAVPAASPATGALLATIQRLSKAQLELFREHYPDGPSGIKLADFGRGFEQFANGELRDPTVTGKREPNSGFFFLFAEFGFLCADSGVDVSEWTQILRIYVAAHEIFMHVYRPAPGTPVTSLDDFDDSNFNKGRQSNETRKSALRKKYGRMNLADLKKAAGKNMHTALGMK
jgi:hypothetical protein